MMKKILWAVAAAATLATPAFAADIPRRQPIADTVYIPAAPAGVWTGFYVGAHLGGAFGSNFRNDVGYGLGGASGFLAGVQAGYDYQFNRVVLGVAGDLTYSTVSRRYIDLTPSDIRAKQDWSGSLRARLGYAVQDNMLLYVTGGLALGNVRLNDAVLGTSQSRMGVGWTLGAGGEYKFTQNWSGLLEYRYTDLGRGTYNNISFAPRVGFTSHTIRTGLNYRF
jgi:outer membrane immunogenic protein